MVASAWVPISVRVELVGLDVHVVKVSYLTTLNLKGSYKIYTFSELLPFKKCIHHIILKISN